MKTYLVGGAVRDTLLGLPVKDRDWVVVGATPRQLTDLGFTPVGKDFPVFLHPRSKEQYALARTERKTAPGYRGFTIHAAPDVTLEQDLARRDLTINAMALDTAQLPPNGDFDPARVDIIDPHQGQRDLHNRILRHVSAAFREDPVRILRVARFAARFSDFQVAPETMALMRAMVAEGEAAALVAERVWQELARGLMENMPSRMFGLLNACGALVVLLPELDGLWKSPAPGQEAAMDYPGPAQAHTMRALDGAAQLQLSLPVRFACLFAGARAPAGHDKHSLRQDPARQLCERIRVPAECRELAELASREAAAVHACMALDAPAVLLLLERSDAFRKPARFTELLQVCACDARAETDAPEAFYPQRAHLLAMLAAAQAVSTEAVATRAQAVGMSGKQVGDMIRAARVDAVATVLRP
jgi:tRNA nucleotidyltransferase (CCA-adding enzyme)